MGLRISKNKRHLEKEGSPFFYLADTCWSAFTNIDEQINICDYLDIETQTFNIAISKAQQEIASIKEYREALITDLVTGKRSVPQ